MNNIIGASGHIKVTQDERGNTVIDIDSTYGGQVSINTVGTITTGYWRADNIIPEHGGTGNSNSGSFVFSDNVTINGPIVINCKGTESIELKATDSGTLATQEESLQTRNALTELSYDQARIAFDHISPTKYHGDISYYHEFIGNANIPIGDPDQFLGIIDNTPSWKDLPISYRYVSHFGEKLGNNETIDFGFGFEVFNDEESTSIVLAPVLLDIASSKTNGIFVLNNGHVRTYAINAHSGINCVELVPQNLSDEDERLPHYLSFSIDQNYPGQESITTVGTIQHGTWESDIISPEYGGTGNNNKYPIILGGNFITNTDFTVFSCNDIKSSLNFIVNEDISVAFENSGIIATKETTLQIKNNLHDLENTKEAFRHLSPTENRGDLIVRGYGDYDITLPIGNDGEVLVVNKSKDSCLEWRDLNIEERLRSFVDEIVEKKFKEKEEKEIKPATKCFDELISIEETLHAVCTQFDSLIRSGQIRGTNELQNVLKTWDVYIKNRGKNGK